MKITTCCAIVLALVMLNGQVHAQLGDSSPDSSQDYDQRVKKVLDTTDLKYEIDSDGDFKLIFEYDDGRSHIVFINSNTETYQNMEIREIWAVGYVAESGTISAPIALNLIRANSTIKLGAWQVHKMGDREVASFRAMISANSNAETITDVLRLVGISADEKEAELTGTDDL